MKVYTDIPQDVILRTVTKILKYIQCTYGPAGRGVLMNKGKSPEILDDGYMALEELMFEDELENTILEYVKEAAAKTNKRAGDGTTTAVIIMAAIVQAVMEMKKNSLTIVNMNDIASELRVAAREAVAQVQKQAKKITTKEDLEKIALNSYNSPEMAKTIAEMILEVGADGAIALEESETLETTTEIVTGMRVDRGYTSPYMAGAEGQDFESKDPYILCTDEKILDLNVLIPVIDPLLKDGKKEFVVFCEELSGEALAVITLNNLKGSLHLAAVKCPGYGESKHQAMQDIATVVGANYISERVGRTMKSITTDDFGRAKRVTISSDETLIVGGKGDKEKIEERAAVIRELLDKGSQYDKDRAQERLASLVGGIGVIRVGAPTEGEMRSIRSKTEDAIAATKLAFKGGVVQGGGITLGSIASGSEILDAALKKPRAVLEENGKEALKEEAQDSAGVLIASIESGVSVAANLITTGAMVAEKREKEDK